MSASDWNPSRYGQFKGQRLRPALDLLSRIGELPEGDVVDLGCGAGAVGPALRARFPERRIIGVDTSPAMLAQAVTGTPGHVNAMADAVAHFIRRIGRQNMFEGDVYITNDPWEGTGHKHDITVVTPSFHNGRLIGFFACTAHITDIGGRGFGADANSVYEEGMYIPIMKFAERGEVNRTLIQLVRGNVREPDQVVGDLFALATCHEIGHRRLVDMMEEFALDDLFGILLANQAERDFGRCLGGNHRLEALTGVTPCNSVHFCRWPGPGLFQN